MNDHTASTGADFARLATQATDHVTFDPEQTLSAVKTQHRRRVTRRRRAVVAVPLVAVLAAGGIGTQTLLAPGTIPAAQAYEFAATDAPVIAELSAGLTVSYLPAELEGEIALSPDGTGPAQDNGEGAILFATDCYDVGKSGQGRICIATAPDLTVDFYLKHNWFEGESTEVNGTPAVINAVTDDAAGGIVFSPEVGTVVEIHVDEELSGELRKIVAGMALERG